MLSFPCNPRVLYNIRQTVDSEGKVLTETRPKVLPTHSSASGKDRLRVFVEFGGERVTMPDRDAIKKAANANSEFASLILLGFKEKMAVPPTHIVEGASYFAYPSERTEGSSTAFAHLHASMLRKGVLAIGELLSRTSATSRLVAMLPLQGDEECQEKDRAASGIIAPPPGMLIIPLPFEDEVRDVGPDAATQVLEEQKMDIASEDVVKATMKLVEKQTLVDMVIGEDFENAYLSNFWDYVESVALEQPQPAEREYDTILDQEKISKLVGIEVEELAAALPEDIKPEKASKKRKISPDDPGFEWVTVYREGRLLECTAADLKKLCGSLGLTKGGNKPTIVDRLNAYYEAQDGCSGVKEEEPLQSFSAVKEEEHLPSFSQVKEEDHFQSNRGMI
jgi:hypothetical protein